MTGPRSRWPKELLLAAVAVGVGSLVTGMALGTIAITPAPVSAVGTYTGDTDLGFWTQVDLDNLSHVPNGVAVTEISTNGATPTELSAGTSNYSLNAATAGHGSVRWNFTESTSAPTSTEVELSFVLVTGTGLTRTVTTVYIETRPTAPSSPITYPIYYDSGGFATPLLDSAEEISQQCSAVGTCP